MFAQKVHRFIRIHISEMISKDDHPLKRISIEQEVFAACAGLGQVNSWVHAFVGKASIKLLLRLAEATSSSWSRKMGRSG